MNVNGRMMELMKTIEEITKALSQEFHEFEETRSQSGQELTYIPWHKVENILDLHAPGWSKEIKKVEWFRGRDESGIEDLLMVTVSITIPYKDGGVGNLDVTRENVGFERFKERTRDGIRDIAYGDVFSNAKSMAFRRAAVDFGVGRYLYDRKRKQGQTPPERQQVQQDRSTTPPMAQGQRGYGPPQRPQQPAAVSATDGATEKQLAAIRAIAKTVEVDPEEYCFGEFDLELKDINRQAASWLIDQLKQSAGQALRG